MLSTLFPVSRTILAAFINCKQKATHIFHPSISANPRNSIKQFLIKISPYNKTLLFSKKTYNTARSCSVQFSSVEPMEEDCCSTQLINRDGMFNAADLENFIKRVKLIDQSCCGYSYAVVSIMGPQSSGKSTLLNHLFRTNFREMDALKGRSQTTKGVWIAKCIGIQPFTIVMDLEGTDGRDRGEDDTAFEKHSALFASAVSDVILINMWCHDIGREQQANKPLLKTVFQVMTRLFSPRRTTLLFVIRDKAKTPLQHLEPILREDIQKIWDTVSKPHTLKDTLLSDFFRVEVTALSSYEEKEEQFKQEKRLTKALVEPVESLFDAAGHDTWSSIRKLLRHETEVAVSGFSAALSGFELDQETYDKMVGNLVSFARSVVEKKAREEAGKVLIHMKDRFLMVFSPDNDSMPRAWTGKEDIRAITKDARAAALKLLSILAAIRLAEKSDNIEIVLFRSLLDGTSGVSSARDRSAMSASTDLLAASTWEEVPPKDRLITSGVSSARDMSVMSASTNLLAASKWEEVPPKDTLITPVQCKSLWARFKAETQYIVTQAIYVKEALRRNNSWIPPPWAIVAMIVLGFNEFMLLLRNPLYLLVIFIIFLLLKALWVQLDFTGEFQNGALTGMFSLSSRFHPTVMNLLKRIADVGQMYQDPEPPRSQTQIPVPPPANPEPPRSQTQIPVPMPMPALVLNNLSSLSSQASSSESGIVYSKPCLRHRQLGDMADRSS